LRRRADQHDANPVAAQFAETQDLSQQMTEKSATDVDKAAS
jgi:hypothetical protein